MADRVGQQFGNYRLLRELGRGNFAAVYLAEHLYLERLAAIKVLHVQMDPQTQERFRREARTIARLQHPHIIQVLDFGLDEQTPYLVMAYTPGGTLRSQHPNGTCLSFEQIVTYVKQIASALDYAHQKRVIHRDVKPHNLLLTATGEVVLSDFGFAAVQQSLDSFALSNPAAGTPLYMAPEQIQYSPCAASDQYALGVMVYEWLAGEAPFGGNTLLEVFSHHLYQAPPSLLQRLPDLPAAVEAVVFRALAKDPKQRFVQIQDFALALEEAWQAESSTRIIPIVSSPLPPQLKPERLDHLPAPLTPLIGREQEVQAACVQLRRPEVRLLTLLGPGGIGKTRLSLQVAAELQAHFADGVCFVLLASIRDPQLVMPTIAQVLTIRESGVKPLFELVKEEVGMRQLLLVLDNVEQVVLAAPQLEALLSACPRLKLLVTSRALLHLPTEHVFPVPPLALPNPSQLPGSESLSQYGAVALFVQRAQALLPTFQLTPTNARAIAQICVQLDGLPLAIELATAHIRLLPPRALLKRLSQRLAILTSGPQTLPERQQTLRNTLKWSYDLLDKGEQQLFRRLSLFTGGCTLEAIEAVCAALDQGNAAGQIMDGVASLINKSLLQQTEQEGEASHLLMLETIREYGLEALAASGEMKAVQGAHAAYYLALAEEAEPELDGSQQIAWLERLEREHDNLRAVLEWSLERGQGEESTQRRELGLRLVGALLDFWIYQEHLNEGRTLLERVLAISVGAATTGRAKALKAAADLAFIQGNMDTMRPLAEEALVIYRQMGDQAGVAFCLFLLGSFTTQNGEHATARSLLEESVALLRGLGNKWLLGWSLWSLGGLEGTQGEYIKARTCYEEALLLFREVGSKSAAALMLFRLGRVLFISQWDLTAARSLIDEALVLSRELPNIKWNKSLLVLSLINSAELALYRDDLVTARSQAEETLALIRENKLSNKAHIAWSLSLLAQIESRQGNHLAARSLAEESLTFAKEADAKVNMPFYLEVLAKVVAAQGEGAWAARLWGTAESLRELTGFPLPPVYGADYEHSVAAACVQVGEKLFTTAWAEGRAMTMEQALASQTIINSAQSSSFPANQLPPLNMDCIAPPEIFPNG